MGEATYYMKMRFQSEAEAKKAFPKILALFKEGSRAEDWWQNHRRLKPKDFWPAFKKKFPKVHRYLGEPSPTRDCNNELASVMNFGSLEDVERMSLQEKEIWYHAFVWHFADWDKIAAFLKSEYGASVSHLSDEYLEPFDLLSLRSVL